MNQILKSFFICFFVLATTALQAGYTLEDCLKNTFSVDIAHRAPPLGLSHIRLQIEKNECEMAVTETTFYFFKKKWIVDVCREPVHIKYGSIDQEVLRRDRACLPKIPHDNDFFCKNYYRLMGAIQSGGLVFAEGMKEDLSADHGKVYCASVLLREYLNHAFVFGIEDQFLKKISFSGVRDERFFEDLIEEKENSVITTPAETTPDSAAATGASPLEGSTLPSDDLPVEKK